MRGLKKNRMKRDNIQIHRRTSQLYDRIGPVGRFDENTAIDACSDFLSVPDSKKIKFDLFDLRLFLIGFK